MDALAAPFVQGHLRRQRLEAVVYTECACCARPLELETDGTTFARASAGAAPVVFAPLLDLRGWKAPSIIDDF